VSATSRASAGQLQYSDWFTLKCRARATGPPIAPEPVDLDLIDPGNTCVHCGLWRRESLTSSKSPAAHELNPAAPSLGATRSRPCESTWRLLTTPFWVEHVTPGAKRHNIRCPRKAAQSPLHSDRGLSPPRVAGRVTVHGVDFNACFGSHGSWDVVDVLQRDPLTIQTE
jgi:hypothetical protein